MKTVENIKIEGAKIVFRNFGGKPDKYNRNGGVRKFAVVLGDASIVKNLLDEGWNVKQFKPKEGEEDKEPEYYLPVKVSYAVKPPHIYICTSKGKTVLTEDTVETLDYADISNVDIVISPYAYSVDGSEGIAAYVKTMYVTIEEDEFAYKYCEDEEDFEIPFN